MLPRSGLNEIRTVYDPLRYGVMSTVETIGGYIDPSSWVGDLASLGVGRVRLRLETSDTSEELYMRVREFAGVCATAGIVPLIVLTPGFAGGDPSAFPGLAQDAATDYRQYFMSNAIPGPLYFELWNEPNAELTILDAAVFANLMNTTYALVHNDDDPITRVVSGGLLYSGELDAIGYLSDSTQE